MEDLEGDIPEEILSLPDLNLRVQFLNMTYLQQDYATDTPGSYVPLCQQHGVPAKNRSLCHEYFFENGPQAGKYNTSIAPDGLEYETTLVNGMDQPDLEIEQNPWYRARILMFRRAFARWNQPSQVVRLIYWPKMEYT